MTLFRDIFRWVKHRYTFYIIGVIIAVFSLRGCYNQQSIINDNNEAWRQLEKQRTDSLTKIINEKGEEIATQEQLVITEKQAKEMALLENERLKKIKSKVKIKTVTKIKHIWIPYDTTIFIHDTLSDSSFTARAFSVGDEWYNVKGITMKKGIYIDNISFNNELSTTIGYKKDKGLKNIFKSSYPVVEVKNNNPYSSTVAMENIVIKPKKKKFYETKGFALGVGILGGFLLFK
jgi:hypothetical protein